MPSNRTPPPFIYEGVDTMEEVRTVTPGPVETIRQAVHQISDAFESARKPGMPLSVLSNIAREAPLGSLMVAFLLGVAVARRR